MAETGYPVIIDATHSVQKPTAMGDSSGGDGWLAPVIARAGLSTGLIGGIYVETHPEPLTGGSDIMNVIPLMYMEEIIKQWMAIDKVAKDNPFRLSDDWEQAGKKMF
jgi:2-dehydro-3-deoxyphosphooctonate aldolase (KDO 8-P synthase)